MALPILGSTDHVERTVIKHIFLAGLTGASLLLAGPALAQRQSPAGSDAAGTGSLTIAERQAAWNDNKAEYRRRVARDGQRSADRWLDQQALAKRGPTTDAAARPRAKGKTNCKKIRWVNRATPGFGGSGITMSRVPVCSD